MDLRHRPRINEVFSLCTPREFSHFVHDLSLHAEIESAIRDVPTNFVHMDGLAVDVLMDLFCNQHFRIVIFIRSQHKATNGVGETF